LSRSQYFGEIGLLDAAGVRTANCSALDHVEVVRIDKADFDLMMQQFPQIKEQLQLVARQRLESNEKRNSMLRTLTLPQYIEQGLYEAQSLLILDLEKCTRCDECVRACAQAHNGVTRLIRDGIRYDKYLVTTACRSCRDPYCMVGCPVGSIRRKDDLEIIIEDHCIGCGRCAEQCPYGNINMHPFEMTFKDPSTGEKRKELRRKAAVCDLCTDQCLDEDEDPSCVYACPHDAAHRVNGQTFFDRELQGSPVKAHS
jgi:Fe-S-cluster-containing hydrogenase component 2